MYMYNVFQECKCIMLYAVLHHSFCIFVFFLRLIQQSVTTILAFFIFFMTASILGKVIDRVNGVKIAELTQKVRQYAQKASTGVSVKKVVSKEDLNVRLKRLINSHEVRLANYFNVVIEIILTRCAFNMKVLN